MTHNQVPEGLGRTAVGMARVRAEESRRPDRLFDDPYAEAFMAAAPGALPEEREARASGELAAWGAAISFQGVIRTRFFDEYLLAASAAGCRQVVLLAAGLDSRAFRLAWPDGVRLYELDLPEVLTFKERVLAGLGAVPSCARTVVAADLRADWPAELAKAGFRASAPTAWLVEGLLIYLTAEDAARLLTAVSELSAPGSQLSFEYRTPDQTRDCCSTEPAPWGQSPTSPRCGRAALPMMRPSGSPATAGRPPFTTAPPWPLPTAAQ